MLSVAENPPQLSPGVRSLTELSGTWWIAHTKAKMERPLVRYLYRHDVGYFLPLLERTTISSGKKRRSLTPMFSGYVFFCGDEQARYQALASNYLCQVIPVREQKELVGELSAIESALAGKAEMNLHPFAVVGNRCRVKAGPFQGLEGIVEKKAGRCRLVLQVTMLGRGASLEIDSDLLEPAS
jgi:transcriptional antiterminator RfaH